MCVCVCVYMYMHPYNNDNQLYLLAYLHIFFDIIIIFKVLVSVGYLFCKLISRIKWATRALTDHKI